MKRVLRRVACNTSLAAALVGLCGCHSRFIEATVVNRTGQTVRLLEVDYPSASFGTQDLPDGHRYHYRFKVLGSGVAKALWTDAANKDHTATGPELTEGQEGQVTVTLMPLTAEWKTDLHP